MEEQKENTGSELIAADALLPQTLFIVPIHTAPIYPGMIAPLVVTKPKLIETIENAMGNRGIVGLLMTTSEARGDEAVVESVASQELLKDSSRANDSVLPLPAPVSQLPVPGLLNGHYSVGSAVKIIKKLHTSDGAVTLLVHSLKRFEVRKVVREEPFTVVQVSYKEDVIEKSQELDALTRAVISQVKRLSEHNPFFTEEIKLAMVNAPGPSALADLVAFALSLRKPEAQDFLETVSVQKRFEKLLFYLKREQEVSDIQKRITEDVNKRIQTMQREFFLKEQLRSIRRELGGGEEGSKTVEGFRERIQKVKLSEEAKKVALEELSKLETTSESSPEYNVVRNYLDWMLSLPWGKLSIDNLDLKHARKVLDEDHYGIEKVKERIIEFLAVRKLNPNAKSSILCFVGPPGVGKTSLGKSIARAMNRNFFRFSLGGMRDEAEIKGHRRTYIGAMPGKLLSALKRAGSQNPVLVLDEVDKLGMSFQGDPASALLEVLDPEQNQSFIDHYLDVAFDLSNVLFILTANTTATIPEPLLDRMEVIDMSGYTLEEKEQIAKTHIIPREIQEHGLKPSQIDIPKATLEKIMHEYCREPGMRSLQQKIATLCRKVAAKIVENPRTKKIKIESGKLYEYLGPERFDNELARSEKTPGVAIGLAWTPLGGQILFIEASGIPRKFSVGSETGKVKKSKIKKIKTTDKNGSAGDQTYGSLQLTGQLGEVMSESGAIAYSFVKKKAWKDKTAQKFFEENEIHLHIPAGAVPKDGPSAGITMATAMYSLVTGKKIKPKLAMTGELSLVGRVLPVGGIKEKVLAAKRAGIQTIIMPQQNKKDLRELSKEHLKGLKFIFVETIDEVLKHAF